MNRSLRIAAVALALALAGVACKHAEPAQEGFGSLTVDQVQALVDAKSASIYDNNQQDRWKQSHVPTATWLAFNDVKASDLPADKNRSLVFYCANPH